MKDFFTQRPKQILLLLVLLAFTTVSSFGQSCSTTFPGGTANWSSLTWTCSGGGTAPTSSNGNYTENLTVNNLGNGDNLIFDISFNLTGTLTVNSNAQTTITVPAGVTVVINGNFTDDNNNVTLSVDGNLVVTGTLKAKNNTTLSGTGSISGGTLDLGGGTTGCAGTCPGLSFTNCSSGGTVCANNSTTSTYTWDGSTSAVWTTSTNWTPDRTTPANTDQLIFNSLGIARNAITNVPSQTVGRILVTGASSYNLVGTSNNTLTLNNIENAVLTIDNGSVLSLGTVGATPAALNLTTPANSLSKIGGQLHMVNGTFTVNAGSTLILHTNTSPLIRTSGQVFLNSTSILQFGEPGNTGGGTVVLPNSIFSGPQTISSLVMNRTNGASLGNQSITVTNTTFTLGNLYTNSAGKLILGNSPTESAVSKIIGYAQMSGPRTINANALNFLGFNMAAGNSVGSVTLTRRTGTDGANSFNTAKSIDVTWDITTSLTPSGGRSVSLTWFSDFDNVNSTANPFYTYYYNDGPGWTAIGTAQALSSTGNPRTSAAKVATDLNDSFTLADNTQILPVSFASFSAESTSQGIDLFWTTATEIDNERFVIEKKGAEGFFTIGEREGAGNSVTLQKYSFTDESPSSGWNYYRIKQIDFDGKFSYSKVVSAQFDGKGRGITIYPNPTSNGIKFNGIEGATTVQIQDLRGRVLYTGTVTNDSPELEVKNYAVTTGIYYVVTESNGLRQHHRIVVK